MSILIVNYCKIIKNDYKNLLEIMAGLLQITTVGYCKLQQLYYKLRQKIITNYSSSYFAKFKIITNYVKFYYKLQQLLVLLQITAGIKNHNVITNYIVTLGKINIKGKKP